LDGALWREALHRQIKSLSEFYSCFDSLEGALSYLCRVSLLRGIRLKPEKAQIAAWREDLQRYLAYLLPGASPSIFDAISAEPTRKMLLVRLRDFPFLVDLAHVSGNDIAVLAKLFDEAASVLGLRDIAAHVSELPMRDTWEARLQGSLDLRFRTAPAMIVALMLRSSAAVPTEVFRQAGLTPRLLTLQKLREDLIAEAPRTIAPFAFFASELDALIDACEAPRQAW